MPAGVMHVYAVGSVSRPHPSHNMATNMQSLSAAAEYEWRNVPT